MNKLILPILIGLLFVGCAEGSFTDEFNAGYAKMDDVYFEEIEATESFDGSEDLVDEIVPANGNPTSEHVQIDQKIIKTGDVSFETDSLEVTKTRIDEIVKSLNGYYASENAFHYTYKNQYNLSIRVPASSFESLLTQIGDGVSHFDSKNISAQDVTEEFIDVEARIKTKKETELRYRELLGKAVSVGEILEIEEQLSYIRSDIESLEGRLKYLKNQVGFSTLAVTFYESIPGGPKQGYSHQFSEGFENGWEGFILFFVGLANLWPFIIIGLIVWFFVRRSIKKRRARKKAQRLSSPTNH